MEGFIDENTWFTTIVEQEKDEEFVRVRTLSPVGEIFARRMERGGRHSDANEQYIAFSGELIDWKNDKNYLTRLSVPWSSGLAVTREGLVLLGVSNGILQSDPVHGEEIKGWGMDLWQFALTPDERHLITVSDTGACKLWQFPERKEIGTCRRGNFFDLDIKPNLALSPDGAYFALTVENEIQVYRVDPFARTLKVDVSGNIYSLAISNNGILALSLNRNTQIWNTRTGKAIGKCDCSPFFYSTGMSLRPDGRQLAIICGEQALMIYDISQQEEQEP
jgi:WD40 repeat protein